MMKFLDRRSHIITTILFVLAICISIMSDSKAQTATGGIRGAVMDENGAAIPGAPVTAKNVNTGTVAQTTTTKEGIYSFARILPGTYNITVEAPAFKKA